MIGTKSAKEIIKECFNGAKLANTSVVKYGKINKEVAFEISRTNNGAYMGTHFLTIVTSKKDLTLDLLEKNCFDTYEEVVSKIKEVKNHLMLIKL